MLNKSFYCSVSKMFKLLIDDFIYKMCVYDSHTLTSPHSSLLISHKENSSDPSFYPVNSIWNLHPLCSINRIFTTGTSPLSVTVPFSSVFPRTVLFFSKWPHLPLPYSCTSRKRTLKLKHKVHFLTVTSRRVIKNSGTEEIYLYIEMVR